MNPSISECYSWSYSRCKLSGEQFSLFTFADNLYDAFLRHRLVRNNGVRTCLPKFSTIILCCGQVDPAHRILFKIAIDVDRQQFC